MEIENHFNAVINTFKCIQMKNQTFEELKEYYNTKNRGCGTGGKVYIPVKTVIKTTIPKGRDIVKKITFKNKTEMISCGEAYRYINREGKEEIFKDIITKLPDPQYERITQKEQLYDVRCNNFSCVKCRSRLKSELHRKIIAEVYRNDLNYHQIITAPGGLYRKNTEWWMSYKIMLYEFHKLIRAINYEIKREREGKETRSKNNLLKNGFEMPEYDFAYITLQRAQTHPKENNPIGFCHLHNIINFPINVKWIEEKIKKNNYKIGYNFIRENQSIAEYLCNDFMKDDEWIIPYGRRHYNTSQNVKVNVAQGYKMEEGMKYYKNTDLKFIEDDLINNKKTTFEVFGKKLKVKNGEILPYKDYLEMAIDITDKLGHKETEMTGNGIHNKYKTKSGMFIKTIGYT